MWASSSCSCVPGTPEHLIGTVYKQSLPSPGADRSHHLKILSLSLPVFPTSRAYVYCLTSDFFCMFVWAAGHWDHVSLTSGSLPPTSRPTLRRGTQDDYVLWWARLSLPHCCLCFCLPALLLVSSIDREAICYSQKSPWGSLKRGKWENTLMRCTWAV